MNKIIGGIEYDTEKAHIIGRRVIESEDSSEIGEENLLCNSDGKYFLYAEIKFYPEGIFSSKCTYSRFITPISKKDVNNWIFENMEILN